MAGLKRRERGGGRFGLELADIGHRVERLAMKVGLLDPVMVDDGESARRRRPPDTAAPGNPGRRHRPPGPTPRRAAPGRQRRPRQHHLAGIAFAHGLLRRAAAATQRLGLARSGSAMIDDVAHNGGDIGARGQAKERAFQGESADRHQRAARRSGAFHSASRAVPCGAQGISLSRVRIDGPKRHIVGIDGQALVEFRMVVRADTDADAGTAQRLHVGV